MIFRSRSSGGVNTRPGKSRSSGSTSSRTKASAQSSLPWNAGSVSKSHPIRATVFAPAWSRPGVVPLPAVAAPALSSGLRAHQAAEVGAQLGRGEGAVLGGEGEVDGGDDGPLEVEVEDALGVLHRLPGQRRHLPGAG